MVVAAPFCVVVARGSLNISGIIKLDESQGSQNKNI
jgi:hypothetical protein